MEDTRLVHAALGYQEMEVKVWMAEMTPGLSALPATTSK
jgi:hypothetical protein